MIVMKFGGTSVGSAREILRVSDLIINEPREKVVVVSAVSGVTDKLCGVANTIVDLPSNVVEEEANKFHREILSLHMSIADEVIADKKIHREIKNKIEELANKLRISLIGVGYLEDLSPKSMDYILSYGERMSAFIVSGALRSKGTDSTALTGYDAGLITDSFFGRARPIHSRIKDTIKTELSPFIKKGMVPVVTGFIAADEKGRITTLGRGGSDYTASLIGKYMGAEEVQIWTDVDGILSADPRVVKNARLISSMSYVEAMDLAYFGANVIHSKMIEPAMIVDIPVRIKNTFNPGCEGTLIVREQEEIEGVVKAVTVQRGVTILNLRGVGMAETPNIAGKVFTVIGDENINIVMISGSSESNLSFVIQNDDVNRAVELLNAEFVGDSIRNLELVNDVCIITIVGTGMQGTKGIAAKIFRAVTDTDSNIIMIAQGSSEVNISFVVEEKDGNKVLSALHDGFVKT